ncbi:MAG: alginate export family protein, partial [Gammaproteobacteria bacterium]
MRRLLLPLLFSLAPAAAGEGVATLVKDGKAGLDLRYRYESVEQDDKPLAAGANTLRLRLNLATGAVNGFSALAEFDHLQAVGGEHHDDTRNGLVAYPVVADPEGTDLNQAYIQYAGPKGTMLRLGRQRINLDNERFIGAVGWRQNEQTYDAFRVETKALPGAVLNYAYIDRVQRVFGPDPGTPPAHLDGASHALTVKLTSLPVGAISVYGFHLDFDNAPQLSSSTWGARYDGNRKIGGDWNFTWTLDYARQQDAGANAASIDAYYNLAEVALRSANLGFTAGRELLSGERGTFTATTNPAFQTPLATLHKWQGWADKFLTTPSAGIEDLYLGANAKFRGWNAQA